MKWEMEAVAGLLKFVVSEEYRKVLRWGLCLVMFCSSFGKWRNMIGTEK